MARTMAARIRALQQMTVAELLDKHVAVFGEESRSRNRTHLWKKIAWRIQELEEGGLTERAKQRARELARDADARVRPPRGAFTATTDEAAPSGRTETHVVGRLTDSRLPPPGTELVRDYKEGRVRVLVLDEGFEWRGRVYRSLTAVANAVTGSHWNGYAFFGLTGDGDAR